METVSAEMNRDTPLEALEYQLAALRHAHTSKQWLAAQGVRSHLVGRDPVSGTIAERDLHLEFALTNTEAALYILPKAVTYFWSPEMMSSVMEASRHYPLDAVLLPERLRDEYFWYWCDKPFLHMSAPKDDGTSSLAPINGIAAGIDGTTGKPHLRVVGFQRLPDRRVISLMADSWLFGEKPGLRQYSDDWLSRHGVSDQENVPSRMFQFVLSAQQWLAQRILRTTEAQLERSARRRATRALEIAPKVSVIALRAYESSSSPRIGQRQVDWSHRWVVSGHWRKQYYPSTGENVPTWIDPYVKGPEDKPLVIGGARVFDVTR